MQNIRKEIIFAVLMIAFGVLIVSLLGVIDALKYSSGY